MSNPILFKPKSPIPLAARRVLLSGTVDHNMFTDLCVQLSELELESATEPIYVDINSTGGNTEDALAIVGRMHASPCPVHTIGYGQIASAATLIFAAGQKRYMSKFGWFMIHDAASRFSGPLTKLRADVKQLEREELQWIELMEQFTGVPKALWADLTAKGSYLTADDCKKLLIVDELI